MKRRRWAVCLLVLWATLLSRVLWLRAFPGSPSEPVDAEGFHLLAVNVMAGRGFAIGWEAPFCPTAVRTPLYPLWLVGLYRLVGPVPEHAILLQILLEVLTAALVIRAGHELSGPRSGVLAGLLYAFNGSTQHYTGYLLSETLLLPLLAAALLLTLRALRRSREQYVIASAFLWGLGLLTKPNVQYLVLAVWLLMLGYALRERFLRPRKAREGHRIGHSLLFGVVLMTVLAPWVVRNRHVTGRWLLSTAFEENLSRVSAVAVLAEVSGIAADPWTETWEYLYGQIVSQAGARYAWNTETTVLTCDEKRLRGQQVAAVAREIVTQHPQTFLATHFWGVEMSLLDPGHRFWYRLVSGEEWSTTGVVDNVWMRIAWSLERNAFGDALSAFWQERVMHIPLAAGLVWWGLMIGRVAVWRFSLRGLWRLRHTPAMWLLGGTLVYLLLLPGPIAYARFYVPAIPVTVILISVGKR